MPRQRSCTAYGWKARKPVRIGKASGYIIWAFTKAPQISSLQDSKPSLLNKSLQEIQTSLCSADSPLLSSPQRLQQLVHGFPAIIQQLSLQRTPLKELISSELLQMPHRFCHSCRAPLHAADKPSQGPAGKKQRAEIFSARRWVVRRLYSFQPFSSPGRTSIPLRLRAIWSHSVEAMMDDSLSLAASDAEEVSGSYHDPAPLYSVQPSASSTTMDADIICLMLWRSWVWNGLPQRNLDEWYLLGRHQAPRQRDSPFFPEVHSEITKSWHKPYSSRLHASSSYALTSVDGAEEKVYDSLPPLDESSLPAHGHWLEGKSRPRQIHGLFSGVRAPCVVEPNGDEGCG